ncbi:hypothetical protein Pcinc_024014 [Petrolisthes cinctipes]|uniref:Lipocalin/cytosolic fatty-acid binding domain-containing protein n=1 Tax=Petrolisthes cinctipes TaxID=88211 RepID=A0AAE1FBT3_PETCI|nr:hypothetical protein Pcinc_024014 [Petrolisthes cinctipes]
MHSAREVVTSGGRGMMVVMVLLSALTVLETSAHSIDMGRCRTDVQGVSDFQQEAFAGKWYVIELSSTSSKCFTMDFKSTSGGYSVVDSQLLRVGGIVDTDIMVETDHVYITTGNGQMTVRVEVMVSPFSDPSVFVLDTDYTSYAALHECGNMVFLRRVEGAILSRTPTLDPEIVSQLREQLSATGANVERMDSIDHSNCPEDPDLVVRPSDWFGADEGDAPTEGGAEGGEAGTAGGAEGGEAGTNNQGTDVNPAENELP